MSGRAILAVVVGCCWLAACAGRPSPEPVEVVRLPEGGIQPQVATDEEGDVHLVYFEGDPAAGDLFYTYRAAESDRFAAPIRVNSQVGSAVAVGTIRGAQVAVGRGRRVHVAWNGSAQAEPKGPGGTPMFYARLNDAGTAFEPQRNLVTWAGGLDGGGAVAADTDGRVYVLWHAGPGAADEAHRAVFLARSGDEGRTFEREVPVSPAGTGACGCCGMRAIAGTDGSLYVLYRAAEGNRDRAIHLLVSSDHGQRFAHAKVQSWELEACPMSSVALASGPDSVWLAWQTEEQIYQAAVPPASASLTGAVPAPGPAGGRKHPALAVNRRGERLLAWTDGTAWARGGAVAWQVYDAGGMPTSAPGRAEGVPVWGLVAAFAGPEDRFVLVY